MLYEINYQQLNGLDLAYYGDSVYEIYVREYLINKGIRKTHLLHKNAKRYVSAKAHAAIYEEMKNEKILTDEEHYYFKRGRNSNSYTKAKNTDTITYRISTGIESLIGYLYASKQKDRLDYIMKWIFDKIESR